MRKITGSILCVAFILNSVSSAAAPAANRNSQISFTQNPEVNSFKLENVKSGVNVGRTFTIDTRDQVTCRKMQAELKLDNRLCQADSERPYSTVAVFYDRDGEIEYGAKIFDISNAQVNNLRNIVLIDIAAFAYLLQQPLDQTHWPRITLDNAGPNYMQNVRSLPVIDKDNFATNYIKHPIAGSIYYSLARHSGASPLEAFGFSVISSTFLWEYGIEAIAEKPSTIDLIATPVIGSILGELSYKLGKAIERNDGRLLGSPALGMAVRVVTDPGYFVAEGLDAILGVANFESAGLYWVVQDNSRSTRLPAPLTDPGYRRLLMQMKLKF